MNKLYLTFTVYHLRLTPKTSNWFQQEKVSNQEISGISSHTKKCHLKALDQCMSGNLRICRWYVGSTIDLPLQKAIRVGKWTTAPSVHHVKWTTIVHIEYISRQTVSKYHHCRLLLQIVTRWYKMQDRNDSYPLETIRNSQSPHQQWQHFQRPGVMNHKIQMSREGLIILSVLGASLFLKSTAF